MRGGPPPAGRARRAGITRRNRRRLGSNRTQIRKTRQLGNKAMRSESLVKRQRETQER